MERGYLSLLMVLVLLAGAVPATVGPAAAVNDPAQPAEGGTAYVVGDWTVQSVLEYHDCTIDVDGDLVIEAGGSLTLDNVTLNMNSTTNGEHGILVLDGATLKAYNGTTITAVNGAFHYTFVVEDGATMELDGATVSQCGVVNDSDVTRTAMFIASEDVRINDTNINNNAMGMVVDSVDISLTNSTINTNAGNGVYLFGLVGGGTYENLNLSFNGLYGMAVIFCEGVHLENVSVTRNSFDGFGTYRSNFTMERIFSFKNNRLGILAQSSNITAWNSTFLGHDWVDVYLTGHNQTSMTGSGNIDLFDTVYNSYHLHDFTQGLNSSYTVNVSASWLDTGDPIDGATIRIFNNSYSSDGNETFSGTAGASGRMDDILLKVHEESPRGLWVHGPHTFEAEKDGRKSAVVFNVSRPWDEVDIDIDRLPPALNITSPANGSMFNVSTIRFEGTASDHDGVEKVEASWDLTTWKDSLTPANWVVDLDLPDGDRTVTVRAYDGFGAVSMAWVNVSVDTVAPPIMITSPIYNELTNRSTVMVKGTTEPGVNLTSGGVDIANVNGTFSFEAALAEGSNTITVTAADLYGNSNSTSIKVRRDSVGPVLNVTWPPTGFGTVLDTVEVSGKVEGADNVSFSAGAYIFETWPTNNRFSHDVPLKEGENVITIRAWDEAGNEDTAVVTVVRDTTRPVLIVTWDGGDLTKERYITINITTEPGANLTVNGVQAENDAGHSLFLFELGEGVNTITVRSMDWLGNQNSTSFQVEADLTPPDVMIDSPVEGFVHGSRLVNLFGTALDNMVVTNVEISIDGGPWLNASGTETWYMSVELASGDHSVRVRAWDLAGNSRTEMVNFSVLEGQTDKELPSIKVTWPKEGSTVPVGMVTFTGTAFDDTGIAKVQYSFDGVNWKDCNGTAYWSVQLDLKKGDHTIYFRAVDKASKTNMTSVAIEVRSSRPKNHDELIVSGLGQLWVLAVLILAIVLVALYLVIMTSRSRKAMDEEERMERETLEEDVEDDERFLRDLDDGDDEEEEGYPEDE